MEENNEIKIPEIGKSFGKFYQAILDEYRGTPEEVELRKAVNDFETDYAPRTNLSVRDEEYWIGKTAITAVYVCADLKKKSIETSLKARFIEGEKIRDGILSVYGYTPAQITFIGNIINGPKMRKLADLLREDAAFKRDTGILN
jgi:hypothetical protein